MVLGLAVVLVKRWREKSGHQDRKSEFSKPVKLEVLDFS
jgi:hypothetical protein